MLINGKPGLLEGLSHQTQPLSPGNGDGQFLPQLVLSEGADGGKRRVLAPTMFQMLGCTGKGSTGQGGGSIRASQSVARERGRPLQRDEDEGMCNGTQTTPLGVSYPCLCRVIVRTRGAGGADATEENGQPSCSASAPLVPLALRLAVAPAEAARSEDTFTLRTDRGEQAQPASASTPWDEAAGLEYAVAGEPAELRLTGPGGREQLWRFHVAAPPRGEPQYPSGRPLFEPQDIHTTGWGRYNANRFRIYFRVPAQWRLAGVWKKRRRGGRPVRALDLDRGVPSVEQLAADFTERFAYYFNGGGEGQPSFAPGQPLPQRVRWPDLPRQLARVLRLDLGGETLFGFEGDVELGGLLGLAVDVPDVHVDWVGLAWPRPRGFAVQTLRRRSPDWASRPIDVKTSAPPPVGRAAELLAQLNERHFLSGRRSWVLGKGAEVVAGLPDDVYYLDTSSIERYTGLIHNTLTHNLGSVMMQGGVSVREAVIGIWSTLLRNYVRLNGFTPWEVPGGGEWTAAPGSPQVLFTEGRYYRAALDGTDWVSEEMLPLHPALSEQMREKAPVPGPPLRPGVYLAARDLAGMKGPTGRRDWVPTHQFLVLKPQRAGDFAEAIDLGDGTHGVVLGGQPENGFLVVHRSNLDDVQGIREFCAPPGSRTVGTRFDTEVRQVDTGSRPIDEAIMAILDAVAVYERTSRREPIRYPSWREQIGTPGCLNSNSWAQSVLESVLGYGRVPEDMGGADTCRDNRIPRRYFRGAGP